MAGYTRQSTTDIIPGAVVRSEPINREFNELRDAFAFDSLGVTGHTHDGSSDQGSYVPLIADPDGNNRIQVDSNNNRFGVFVEAGGVQAEQLRIEDGLVVPVSNNDISLGTTSLRFSDAFFAGDLSTVGLSATGSAVLSGDFTLSGAAQGAINMNGNDITGLPSSPPTSSSAASRDYVLSVASGGITDILQASLNLSDLDNVATARTNLGLGSVATQDSGSVTITGGSVTGITDLAVADGGTGASTASAARANLGIINSSLSEVQYVQVSAAASVSRFNRVFINAGSAYTLTVPSSPSSGDWIEFVVGSGNAETNNVTVSGNGNTINGDSTLVMDLNNVSAVIVYNGTEWRVANA